ATAAGGWSMPLCAVKGSSLVMDTHGRPIYTPTTTPIPTKRVFVAQTDDSLKPERLSATEPKRSSASVARSPSPSSASPSSVCPVSRCLSRFDTPNPPLGLGIGITPPPRHISLDWLCEGVVSKATEYKAVVTECDSQ
ncbi:hypothetical protein KIPB_015672, partial [Kipferlia bialata]